MARERRTGAVYPIRFTRKVKRRDGSIGVHEYWHAKVNGKWVTAKTYRECDAKIRERLAERGKWGMNADRKATIGEYAAQWFELKRADIAPASIDLYKSVITRHLSRYADVALADVTPSMVRRMIANMRNYDGSTPSYERRMSMYGVLNQMFRAAVADRLIPTSPVSPAVRPKRPVKRLGEPVRVDTGDGRSGEQHRHAFTPEQMRAMLEASSGDIITGVRQWWRLLTGMRQGEILGATLDELRLWREPSMETDGGPEVWIGQYTVNWKLEELNRMHGCGQPDGHGAWPCGFTRPVQCPHAQWVVPEGYDMIHLCKRFALTPPKSHRGKIVPIIPQLGSVLHRYLAATRDVPNPYGLIFRNPDGTPIDALADRALFRELMRRAGIPDYEHRYGHECRNSVVSLLFSMGVDPGIIQRIVGHSSLEMSEHYRSVPIEDLMRGMETLGRGLALPDCAWDGDGA